MFEVIYHDEAEAELIGLPIPIPIPIPIRVKFDRLVKKTGIRPALSEGTTYKAVRRRAL